MEGTWNAEYAKEVAQKDNDIILTNRTAFDAFEGTGLAEILESNNIGYFFVGGLLSNLCVEESMRTASEIEGVSTHLFPHFMISFPHIIFEIMMCPFLYLAYSSYEYILFRK